LPPLGFARENAMRLSRRRLLELAGAAAALPVLSRSAWPQAYPSRPVRILVGFPAGSTTDTMARLVGQWLSERLGQPFVVENKVGAAGNLAAEAVVRSPADGYTLLVVAPPYAVNATLFHRLNFNFLQDIAPIATINNTPFVMVVNPMVPTTSVAEFIDYAKANPGKINMASAGNGTLQHVAGELFKMMTGIDLMHVPFRGTPQALTDLMGGRVQVMFDTAPTSIALIKTGRLRALAVATAQRLDALPDVPTVGETVPGYEVNGWVGLGAPAGTPVEIVEFLNMETNAALADPTIAKRIADLGATVFASSPTHFRKHVANETAKWAEVVKFAGLRMD
jgi:tripartite-type tricarboxylate transporter receptor subunit TctC